MTDAEKQSFLAGLHVGVLALPRADAGPLTVPIWYDYRPGQTLWFITDRDSMKGRLLATGVRVSLCAQNEKPPYQYVSVEGPITAIEPTAEELLPMAIRYLGESAGRAYAAGSSGDGSITVHVAPQRWLAVDYGKSG